MAAECARKLPVSTSTVCIGEVQDVVVAVRLTACRAANRAALPLAAAVTVRPIARAPRGRVRRGSAVHSGQICDPASVFSVRYQRRGS
jgi:hypothetical protein